MVHKNYGTIITITMSDQYTSVVPDYYNSVVCSYFNNDNDNPYNSTVQQIQDQENKKEIFTLADTESNNIQETSNILESSTSSDSGYSSDE